MAELTIHTGKIKRNIQKLSALFSENDIQWSLVTKVFSGDRKFLRHLLTDDIVQLIGSVGDSRLTSLKNLKRVNPGLKTIYIKPPSKIYAEEVVRYADISLNSSLKTIETLNEEARKAGKIHDIIIMIELGEIREGINETSLLSACERIFAMENIRVLGLGSNLGCMYGVEPTYGKLERLLHYKTEIEQRFDRKLELVSGGTSITLPLLDTSRIPKGINHFRVGEAVFFGVSPLYNERFGELETDIFDFTAHVIELEYKHITPDGEIGEANIGQTREFDPQEAGQSSYKAILDFGMLDVDKADIEFEDPTLSFVGMTSDMLVIDLGDNRTADGKKKYSVGDRIRFLPNYMAVARLLNSKFIDKKYV